MDSTTDRTVAPRSRTQKAVEAAQRVADGQKTFRSTEAQRQTFLEGLYSNYAELHRQGEDLQERKQRMESDGFKSNNREIHTLLFGNVSANEEELGDWDTWERVESVVKKFAYGRSAGGAGDTTLSENRALQARLDTLLHSTASQRKKIATLTRNATSVQEELQGLLNLLQMKDRAVRTLTSKNNTLGLQVRQLERECSLLRGEKRKREETEQLFSDVKYLIDVNKQLENENVDLRAKLRAAATQPVASGRGAAAKAGARQPPQAAAPGPRRAEPDKDDDGNTSDSLELSELPRFLSFHIGGHDGETDDELRSLREALGDDTKRRAYIAAEAPITGMAMDVKRSRAAWMRRLEAEVDNVMCALDFDAVVPVAREVPSAPPPLQRSDSTESLVFDLSGADGAFTDYEGYKRPSLLTTSHGAVKVTVAPAVTRGFAAAAASRSHQTQLPSNPTSSSSSSSPSSRARQEEEKGKRGAEEVRAAVASGGEVPFPVLPRTGPLGGGGASHPLSHASPEPRDHATEVFLTETTTTSAGPTATASSYARSAVNATVAHTSAHATAVSSALPSRDTRISGQNQVASTVGGAGMRALQRSIMGLAAYSRRECLRREVLHVNQLRRRLAEARALVDAASKTPAAASLAGPATPETTEAVDASGATSHGDENQEAQHKLSVSESQHRASLSRDDGRRTGSLSATSMSSRSSGHDEAASGVSASVSDGSPLAEASSWAAAVTPKKLMSTLSATPTDAAPRTHSAASHSHHATEEEVDATGAKVSARGDGNAESCEEDVDGVGWASEVRRLRRHLETTRGQCEGLRDELRAFFTFMGELLFEITNAVPDRVAEAEAQRISDHHAVRAVEDMTDDFVRDAVEQHVRDALLAQHNLVLPPAKKVTDDMPDDEWLQQKLRSLALQTAMERINVEKRRDTGDDPEGVRHAGRGPWSSSASASQSVSRDRSSRSTAAETSRGTAASFAPSVEALASGRVEQSAFFRDILCRGDDNNSLSAASLLRGQALGGWPTAAQRRTEPLPPPSWDDGAGDDDAQLMRMMMLMKGGLPQSGQPDELSTHMLGVGARYGERGEARSSQASSGPRNALDYFPGSGAEGESGASGHPSLHTGSPFVLQGQRISPSRHTQAPHPQANQWFYYARGAPDPAAQAARLTQLVGRYRNQKCSRNVLQLLRDLQPRRVPGAEDQLQPDVYRYNITTTMQRAVDQARERREVAMRRILTPQFDEYVARFVMPLASAAAQAKRLAGGGGGSKDAALTSAIRALREREGDRRRQQTRLVFARVANNIRTRQLLQQQHVEKGSAFTTYVAILYERWREQLHAQELQHALARDADKAQLLRLVGIRNELSSAPSQRSLPSQDTRLPSIAPSAPSSSRGAATKPSVPPRHLGPSSSHFEGATFRAGRRK